MDQWEWWCQDPGALLPYPWRERGKPLEGRAVAHFDCVVCLCCVFVMCFVFLSKVSYHTCWKFTSAKAKLPTFAPSYHKNCAKRPQILMQGPNCHSLQIRAPFWHRGAKQVCDDLWGCKKCAKLLLGRVPSNFFGKKQYSTQKRWVSRKKNTPHYDWSRNKMVWDSGTTNCHQNWLFPPRVRLKW